MVASPSTLAAEADALTEAFRQLRSERNPLAALAVLDGYAARFPDGKLRREGAAARVEALLALGRREDARTLLLSLPLHELGRGDELRVIRAELSAPSDCLSAVADFDAVLSGRPSAGLQERALHGRAVCRLRLADAAGSESDLREYLRRFPDGRFAAEVRKQLASR